jgi:hypothetical protein
MDTNPVADAPAQPAACSQSRNCQGWNAPRSAAYGGPAVPVEKREQAVALASAITLVPLGTPIPVRQLAEKLGPQWDAGAEEVVDLLEEHGLAQSHGEGDDETVAFMVAPDPAHV